MVDFVKKLPTNNVLIVDALNIAFRWKHKGSTDFVQEYLSTVNSLARSYSCGTILIAADWGSSSFRKDLFPEYKANRAEIYANQTPEEEQAFKDFIDEYENTLAELSKTMEVFRFKNVEADDIAAYICSNRVIFGYDKIWLISSDRDWDLLVDEHISRFSTVTRKEQTLITWDNEVPPEDYLSFKCLNGDKGDNIPGIPGIGPVRAASLIAKYGSAFDVYDACPIDSKYKYIQNLNENYEQILINYELMDLKTHCEEAIGDLNVKEIARRLIF